MRRAKSQNGTPSKNGRESKVHSKKKKSGVDSVGHAALYRTGRER